MSELYVDVLSGWSFAAGELKNTLAAKPKQAPNKWMKIEPPISTPSRTKSPTYKFVEYNN